MALVLGMQLPGDPGVTWVGTNFRQETTHRSANTTNSKCYWMSVTFSDEARVVKYLYISKLHETTGFIRGLPLVKAAIRRFL